MKANIIAVLFILFACILSCNSKQDATTNNKPKQVKDTINKQLLGDGYGLNGATIIVQNLDSARKYYTKVLGFNLPTSKTFDKGPFDGTIGTSLSFADQSYLELMAINDTGKVPVKDSFITSFEKNNEGVRLYSFSTSSADTTFRWLTSQKIKTDSVRTGRYATERPKGWSWDDGGPQWRRVDFDSTNPPAYLPFFLQYAGYNYQEMQVYFNAAVWRRYYPNNPNGVVGITSLLIVVKDLKAARKEFNQVGFTELAASDTLLRFKIAYSQELHITAPKSPGDAYDKFLKKRGQGVYSIGFEVKSFKDTRDSLKKKLAANAMMIDSSLKHITVLKEYAFGVQLEFTEESKEQSLLATIYDFKEDSPLSNVSSKHAEVMYAKYCALCHGKDREGYAADNAPSLRSHSLMATTLKPRSSYNYLDHTVSYGRAGTAMAPYSKDQGGPLQYFEIELLLKWLHEKAGVKKPIELSADPVKGNATLGKELYMQHCAACHGAKGEGIKAPALANPMLLATASDAFLRYTITEGRDSTPMPSFKDSLSKTEINNVTAYIRSRASGWTAPEAVTITEPSPKDYVIHPNNKAPKFTLKGNQYVAAKQVLQALKDSSRMVILDARSKAAWHQTHIPGAVSVPYYEQPDKFIKNIPNDSTWVVVYCACPHAASTQVVNTLKRFGYKHTAILDEGILVWAQLGYPVQYGESIAKKK